MNMFYRRSIEEYQRQISLKDSFAIQTERLGETAESVNWAEVEEPPTDRRRLRRRLRLLLLFPLVEIAWADGRVSRRESDAILQAAAAYRLTDDEAGYCELLERLTSRPTPQTIGRTWQDFYRLFENLSEFERQTVAFCLTVQTQFVAEQSSDNLMALLRGERISESERETLRVVAEQLKNAQAAAEAAEEKRNAVLEAERKAGETGQTAAPTADDYPGGAEELEATLEDYGKLVPLVPLVKTAWAEGRVTRRERHLVFEAAARMGVKPGTAAHRRLSEWLELHPTAEFYDHALDVLRLRWQRLDAEEKSRRRFDLLSDCARIAEASGGGKDFPAGGARVCGEEIAVVKRIAKKLNAPPPPQASSPDALISLAA